MGLTIYPICLGYLEVDKSIQLSMQAGEIMHVACIAWLIEGTEKNIIVDTGPASPDWSKRFHRPMKKSKNEFIDKALSLRGIKCCDIDIIINTHLHWDHCYGNIDLPNATILVQRDELRYAAAPWPRDSRAYEFDLKTSPFLSFYDRIEVIDGNKEILPGIQLIKTPGHTPGLQSVAVMTDKGKYIIASDTFNLYENLKYDPPWPPGLFYDLEMFYKSAKLIIEMADYILPGHDPKVLDSNHYP